ncbi:hypothetical protein HG536_0B07040 [Torulaspora globosa]|uniref:Enoyl reductase (ER) domain-containing protein n=1 Tax=Torulaspora globosa TaxID=48254 RepID=A0A7G3ZEA0_9SACH|nr:uncharacterized protein HG536_0B07040 [Torulaspora globosa]QLL31836.1 hypothetical protein HG536_0B07040 [Torulaspora globosa]
MVSAKQWVIKSAPQAGEPFNFNFDDPESTFKLNKVEISADTLRDGEILVETLYLSNDPAQKFWIASVDKNYSKGVEPGEIIPARGLGKVLASKNENYAIDDYVMGRVGWTTAVVISDPDSSEIAKISKDDVEELWWYLSVLGATALTAYFIFFKYAGLKETEECYGKNFLISGAAGAVGSLCTQIAVNVFKASKVIVIAGGPEKVRYLESLGRNVVGVDYKSDTFKHDLETAAGGPDTVDFFIDNVGGDILDLGVNLMKVHGTVVACGSISGYNDPEKLAFKNYVTVITKRLTLRGLLVTDCRDEFPEALAKLKQWIKNKYIDAANSATIVDASDDKFDLVPVIWSGLFKSINKGKLISMVKKE